MNDPRSSGAPRARALRWLAPVALVVAVAAIAAFASDTARVESGPESATPALESPAPSVVPPLVGESARGEVPVPAALVPAVAATASEISPVDADADADAGVASAEPEAPKVDQPAATRPLLFRLNDCFEHARATNPALKGQVEFDLAPVLSLGGASAGERSIVRSDLPPVVTQCMREALLTAGAPPVGRKHPGRTRTTLQFPNPALERLPGGPRVSQPKAIGPHLLKPGLNPRRSLAPGASAPGAAR